MTTTGRIEYCEEFAGSMDGSLCVVIPDGGATSTTLSSLTIGYGPGVHSIEVAWSDETSIKCGSGGLRTSTFELMKEERITLVEVYYPDTSMNPFRGLSIETNFGRNKRFGSNDGQCFTFDSKAQVTGDQASSMGLLGFQLILANGGIRGLSPVWAEYVPIPVSIAKTTVKYERDLPLPEESESSTPGLAVDSEFTRILMSPIITLHVGPAGKTFYVHEAMLCKLPFFRSALNGSFVEATLRAVTLLEDDPAAVSALVEFLSTGTYTFAFHAPVPASRPPKTANEGNFHIGVYVVADKYDCTALAVDAKHNLREVMKELSGPDLVHAWIAAYEAGMRMQGNKGTNDDYEGAIDTRVLLAVKGMLENDEDEIDWAVREVPNFGKDLLKIAMREAFTDQD